MKRMIVISLLLVLVAGGAFAAKTKSTPKVDVVFVLDTTGSMGGLIEGAKLKIWSIANSIVGGEPTPDLRVGLVGYRDVGDEYVTARRHGDAAGSAKLTVNRAQSTERQRLLALVVKHADAMVQRSDGVQPTLLVEVHVRDAR